MKKFQEILKNLEINFVDIEIISNFAHRNIEINISVTNLVINIKQKQL